MERSTLLRGLLTAALLVMFAAGCGGGGDSGKAAARPLAPAAFLAKANGACNQARQEIHDALGSYQKEHGSLNPGDVGVAAVAATLLPVQKRESARLEAITPPAEISSRYKAFLRARESTLAEIEARGLSSNSELFKAFERADKMAVALQLEACSFS